MWCGGRPHCQQPCQLAHAGQCWSSEGSGIGGCRQGWGGPSGRDLVLSISRPGAVGVGGEETEWLIFKRYPFSIVPRGHPPLSLEVFRVVGATFGSIPCRASYAHPSFPAMYRPYRVMGYDVREPGAQISAWT